MLKYLKIDNLILVEKASISFEKGMNVLSGETGAGKSAIMEALNLLLGARADSSLLRKGAEKAIIEASFSIGHLPELIGSLQEWGIDHAAGEDLILRREISLASASRAFINHQLAQVSLLRKAGEHLMEIVAQHASQRLLSLENHRRLLDLYGDLADEATQFKNGWEEEHALRKQLQDLINCEAVRLRQIEICRMELEELEAAQLKEGEDEQLFEEYSLLANAEERSCKAGQIADALAGEKGSVVQALKRCQLFFQQLAVIDGSVAEQGQLLTAATLELEEVNHFLRNYHARVEYNPQKMAEINDRLTLINRLKKKYGSSIEEIRAYQAQTQTKLASLENTDEVIDKLRASLESIEKGNQAKAEQLTRKRGRAAQSLEKDLITQLRALNMPKAEFQIELTAQKRSGAGDDQVQFFLVPNPGEHRVSIKDCASGGELSRLMLALQVLLAGKESISTLIFDEIDANIGGATASIVGHKLKEIGQAHQVICITHFPQVAQYADHHIRIKKEVKSGRTFTLVTTLDDASRQEELSRMQGATKT